MKKVEGYLLSLAAVSLLYSNGSAEMAVDFLTIDATPDSPANYGWGYDSRSKQTKGICVNFSSDDTYDAGESTQESHYELAESTSDVAKKSSISASASLNAVAGGAKISASNKTSVVAETEASSYNLTLFASAYRYDEPKFKYLEYAQLTSDMVALLNDPQKRGEFKQRCGDGFILGVQKGRDFLGTATVKKQSLKQSTDFATETGIGVKSVGYSADASVDVTKSLVSTFGSSNFEIHTYSTGSDDPNPSSVKDFNKYYNNFFSKSKDYKRTVKYIVIPYTVLPNYPYEDILTGDSKEDYIGYMADTLWDLKAAVKDADFVLSSSTQPLFALGTSSNVKQGRVNAIKTYRQAWQKEFKDLLKAAQKCNDTFTDKCAQLGDYYHNVRQLAEVAEKVMPDRYASDCYTPITVDLNTEQLSDMNHQSFKDVLARLTQKDQGGSFDVVAGDNETGGNHMRVVSILKLNTDKRKLKADLDVAKIEWKNSQYQNKPLTVKDNAVNKGDSGYAKKITATVFDLDSSRNVRNLGTCTWKSTGRPVKVSPFKGPIGAKGFERYGFNGGDVYGLIDSLSKKDARGQAEYGPGKGLLTGIRCAVDAKGKHDNQVGCESVSFKSFDLDLVSTQDQAADRWRDPKLDQEPTILTSFLNNKPLNYQLKRTTVQQKYKIPSSQLKLLTPKIKNLKTVPLKVNP